MTRIGWIGTGLMGAPMARRLLGAGESVTVYNRTPDKALALKDNGAAIASSSAALIAAVDVVFLMVADRAAIEQVLLDSSVQLTGKTIIQMGTIAPNESQAIAQSVVNAGGQYLEAPVLGSIPQAKDGSLIVMVGSTAEPFTTYAPLLNHLGENPIHVGEVGTAAALKLAMNQLIGSLTAAFSLSLGLVQRYGVEVDTFMDVVRQSALYAPTFDKKLSRMCDRNFENPNFPTKHLLKDTKLAIAAADAVGQNTAALTGLQDILERAIAQQLADLDYSALFNVVNPE
jgi:3-hydroxyisobutyrate dehydrogenase